MKVNISLDGVLRNTIQKFEYHYHDYYIESEVLNEDEEDFEYGLKFEDNRIQNDDLMKYFKFQSEDEFKRFLYVEFPIEIFGHAGLSYKSAINDLNALFNDFLDKEFRIIGTDVFLRAKPASLFFLSKTAYIGNFIKFIKSDEIKNEWENCDMWITDSKKIIDECPKNKHAIKFNTKYNDFFNHTLEINKLNEIKEIWKSLEKNGL